LPNRKALLDALHARLEIKGPGRHPGALLLIDLDNFKILNDTRGHDIGDQLLIEVARRLQALAAPGDMVARMGGDEFMLLLSQPGAEQAALEATRTLARKILDILALPYRLRLQIAGTETQELLHQCTASIGIALLGRQDHAADELMKQADTAMYRAKAAGRHTALFYDPAMQADVTARALLELELHQALREDQFLLHYQAQVDIEHRVLGVEALIRWQHPRRGAVSPLEFVPLAEEVGLILPIGEWVLNTACAQLAAWSRSKALAGLSMAVNVSAKQFLDVHFVRQVLNAVQLHGIDPTLLKLEITESLLLHDLRYIAEKMGALKSHGIRFSMDDFGTGYSSLSYLQRLPFDQLKIDRAFVSGVGTEGEKSPIVSAIIALGQNLGLDVIAEGVETEIQRDTLAAHGCLVYQGYLYNRPMPAAEFESWLQQAPHPMA
ncbi:MAG: EAL domain-containing protein, partial [Curvibacter sp.]|nr:EAL domain-containing protein [Curvibacter sp.]